MGQENPQAPVLATLIFDSDVLIWILRGHGKALQFAGAVAPRERNVSVISYLELIRGCRDQREARDFNELIEGWFNEVIPLKPEATDTAVSLMVKYGLSHRPGVNDVLIAATALSRSEALATGNVKHFAYVPGLVVRPFHR